MGGHFVLSSGLMVDSRVSLRSPTIIINLRRTKFMA